MRLLRNPAPTAPDLSLGLVAGSATVKQEKMCRHQMATHFILAATIVCLLLTASDAAYTCPSGFTGLTSSANGAYCYAAFNNGGSGISWSGAETACLNTGVKLAHLASIRDATQQAAVVSGRCGGTIPTGHAYWVSLLTLSSFTERAWARLSTA